MRRTIVAWTLLGTLAALAPASAFADTYASSDSLPLLSQHNEDEGHRYKFRGQLLGTAFSERIRVGGEIEFSKYETSLAGLPGIQVKSYNLRGVVQLVAWPNRLSPYCGGAVGVDVRRLDRDAVESVITSIEVDNFGIALGGLAFVGIQMPIAEDLSLFTEARVGAVFDVIDRSSVEMGAGSLDGYSAMTGLRMRF